MANEFVCSVQKENKLGFYRIHSIWSEEELRVNIASKDASWSGEVSRGRLEDTSKRLNQLPELYLEECKAALTTDEGAPGISYAVENGSFVWKKTIDEEIGMKVQLGSIPLEPTNFVNTIQKMMDVALISKQTLQKRLAQSDSERDVAKENVNKMFKKLDICETNMKNMENELLCNMLAVLNAKKKRISELEQEITILRSQGSKTGPAKRRKPKIKPEDNAYDMDTDEDMPLVSSKNEKLVPNITNSGGCSKTDQVSTSSSPEKMVLHSSVSKIKTPDHIVDNATSASNGMDNCVVSQTKENDTNEIKNNKLVSKHKEITLTTIPSKSTDILGFFFGSD